MVRRIFISYAFQDKKYLGRVIGELRKHGIVAKNERIGLDLMNNLKRGFNIRTIIRERIQRASIVVILWTEEGAMSHFVNYEIGMAEALGKQIIIVVPKNQTPRVPIGLSGFEILRIDYEEMEGITMARNERTSKRVGKIASQQLRSKRTSKAAKSTAASALTQRPDRKKRKK